MSLREAAQRTGISRQTLSDIMRGTMGVDNTNVRPQRRATLRKIATALEIPFELIEREAMADWGLIKTVSAETVQGVLSQLQGLDAEELAVLQMEIGRIQQELASGRRVVPPNGQHVDEFTPPTEGDLA